MALDLWVIIGIVLCVTQPVTIIANLLTIIAFVKIPSLQTHKSNLLIFALSIADFISGVDQLICYGIPFQNTYNAGNYLLVAISIDRVLLVSMDYSKYIKMMTKFRLILAVGICFVIGQIPTVFDLSFWNYAKRNNVNAVGINFEEICLYPAISLKWYSIFSSLLAFFLPLFLVGIFSIIFLKRLIIRINNSRQIVPETQNNNIRSVGENLEAIPRPTEETSYDTTKKRYIKHAITLAALVSAMAISMLPHCINLFVESLTGSLNVDIRYITWSILQLNPCLDPLFFAATQKGIREYYGSKIRALSRALRVHN